MAAWKRAGETPFLVYVERKSTLSMVLETMREAGAHVAAIDGSVSSSRRPLSQPGVDGMPWKALPGAR